MSLRDNILSAYRFNLWFVKKAVEDVTDEQMFQQPKPGMNHAAWVLGHLCMERIFLKNFLNLDQAAPAGWEALFMPGSTPVADAGKYPKKAELIAALEETHAAVEAAFAKLSDADLDKPNPKGRMSEVFPKYGDAIVSIMTSHAGFHVGQLSAWRRAMGLKSIF